MTYSLPFGLKQKPLRKYFEGGSSIRNVAEGMTCSHSNFKKMCIKCMQHYSKDYQFHHAMYLVNKQFLEVVN